MPEELLTWQLPPSVCVFIEGHFASIIPTKEFILSPLPPQQLFPPPTIIRKRAVEF